MLNLAELGFGAAVVYSLYKPVAERDTDTVCAYLGTYRKIYRVIGLVILAAGLAVMPFFPYVLRGQTVPGDMDIFIWYLIFLADAVVSYLLFGYKTAIPSALQRNDLLSRVDTVVLIGKSLAQIAFLLLTDNFYFYLLSSLGFTVLRNFLISHLVERHYPQYVCRGKIDAAQFGESGYSPEEGGLQQVRRNGISAAQFGERGLATEERGLQQVRRDGISAAQWAELKRLVGGLALSKFRGASRHMIDSLCITVFVSLTVTAIYSNYFLILTAVTSLFGIIGASMVASVGNSIVTESVEKNYRDMRRFNFMYMLLAGWAVICMLCLYQPFVQLWMGGALAGNTVAAGEVVAQSGVAAGAVGVGEALAQSGVAASEALMLDWPEVVALCLYFYVLKMGDLRWIYFEGAGLWWKARYIVIAEIICNIVLNIVLAKYWGVLGIIVATLISLFFINFIGEAWILFKEYFKNGKLGEFFADQTLYFVVTVILAGICFWACKGASAWLLATGNGAGSVIPKSTGILDLFLRLAICSFVSVAGYYLAYCKTKRFQDACSWVTERLRLVWTEI